MTTWRERLFDLAEAGRTALLRLVGLAFVAATVLVWGQMLGLDMPGMRSGLDGGVDGGVDGPARSVGVVLAVLCPVTAIGLWSLAPWGQVVWAVTMALHVAAVLQGWVLLHDPSVVLAFHVACLVTFAATVLARLIADRE